MTTDSPDLNKKVGGVGNHSRPHLVFVRVSLSSLFLTSHRTVIRILSSTICTELFPPDLYLLLRGFTVPLKT